MYNIFIKEYKKKFTEVLQNIYEKDELDAIFKLVIEHIFNIDYVRFSLESEREINLNEQQKLSETLERLSKNEPVQHIIGSAHFYDLEFEVNTNVLIPRQETELLVHLLIEKFKQNKKPLILDIGTGSGCIAISLKKNLPEAMVYALDISDVALVTAEKNAHRNNVEIKFIKDNILNPGGVYNTPFDLIVSNPPYVRISEKIKMHKNVTEYDPKLALFVEDDDPLIFYSAISYFANKHLVNGGILAFEINEAFGKETKELILSKGFAFCEIIKDLNGKDRIVIAKKHE